MTRAADGGADTATDDVLAITDLSVDIRLRRSVVHAVGGVSLRAAPGETVGIVGESGSGKSTLGLAVAGLLPANARARGSVRLAGRELVGLPERDLMKIRGADVGIVFQDPMSSLNPTKRIGAQVGEALRLHKGASKAAARTAAAEMLALAGMPRPRDQLDRFPHELSGGMRQRAVIAAALVCEPKLLIADEPTTALDVTTQSQILDLFDSLREQLKMAVLLVTHDMGVVAGHTDRVYVMYAGRGVETGGTAEVFERPRHRYTDALLAGILRMETARKQPLSVIGGRPPDLTATIAGCPFAPRCPSASEECGLTWPPLAAASGHEWHCHHPAGTDAGADESAGAGEQAAANSREVQR